MNRCTFQIDRKLRLRRWPRIESYQNSTLRYTPPEDFPAFWSEQMDMRPKILRVWVTLDEIWEPDTDTYDWDYLIGVDKQGEKRHYPYDWPVTRPSETHFEKYLTSYCAIAEEAMLNIRRFERETADGVLSYEKYEEVVEKVIEHCVRLCPNIRWIEALNESEIRTFGMITVAERVKLYDCICRAVNRLNSRYGWELRVGGVAITGGYYFKEEYEYLRQLSVTGTPERRIDFYSYHSYRGDRNRLTQMYVLHKAAIEELGLPDAPMFMDEFGTRPLSGERIENLMNACGTLAGMLHMSDMRGLYVFPWCTYHNPELQMVYTQYLRAGNGYTATPNAFAVRLLRDMLEDELVVEEQNSGMEDFDHRVLYSRDPGQLKATASGNEVRLIVTNPNEEEMPVSGTIFNLEGSRAVIELIQVDEQHNYFPDDPADTALKVTERKEVPVIDGSVQLSALLPRFGFAGIRVTVFS